MTARVESRAAARAGLARLRPLAIKPVTQSKLEGLPDGWYFNEQKQDQFWKDMESNREGARNEMQDELLKKTEHATDLQDTSGKIRLLVEQFDDIDQDTLMTLIQLYDEGNGAESMDQHMIMNDSKTHVMDFMTQLKGLSDSQTSLMETLRFWFSTLQQHSQTHDSDIASEEMPTCDEVFEQMAEMVRDYTEKSEHVACLHNDINDFWFKQISQFKRTVMMRDEEIRKLQHYINESTAAAQARRARKKVEEKKQDDVAIQKEQLAAQLRINQEQKQQIDQLKSALKENEVQRVALGSLHGQSKDRLQVELLERDSDLSTLKMEFESRVANQADVIRSQEEAIEGLKKEVRKKNDEIEHIQGKLNDMEKERDELDVSLKKQLQLLELERQKLSDLTKQPGVVEVDRHEIYEIQLAHEDEMRGLITKHKQELALQSEMCREKYLKERDKLLKSLESNDTSSLLQTISEECERKIESLRQENDKQKSDLIQQMATKQALLTRQYENRIKAINASHEVDLMMARDAAKYDLKKAEIELEEKYHLSILEMNREKQEKFNDFQRHLERLNAELAKSHAENEKAKAEIEELKNAQGIATIVEEVLASGRAQLSAPTPEETAVISKYQAHDDQLAEKYLMKLKVMKDELEDQMKWELEKQKVYYEREMNRQTLENQEQMRERLMQLQEALVGVRKKEKEGDVEEPQDIGDIINNISTTFEQMNQQIEHAEEASVPLMPIEEAAARTKVLTDRLIQLSSENQELRRSAVFPDITDDVVANLKKRIAYLESLQNGDSEAAAKKFREMEDHYKHELDVKEQMLLNFSKINEVFQHVAHNKMKYFFIYTRAPDEEGEKPKESDNLVIRMATPKNPSPVRSPARSTPRRMSFSEAESLFDQPPDEIYEEEDILETHSNNELPITVPKPPDSAPVEVSHDIPAPAQSPQAETSRKSPKRVRMLPTVSESTQTPKTSLVLSPDTWYDQWGVDPGLSRDVSYVKRTDEELQTQIKADIVPKHAPEEKKLVETVVDEVIDRLAETPTSQGSLAICMLIYMDIVRPQEDDPVLPMPRETKEEVKPNTPVNVEERREHVIREREIVEVPAAPCVIRREMSRGVEFDRVLQLPSMSVSASHVSEWLAAVPPSETDTESVTIQRCLMIISDEVISRAPSTLGTEECQTDALSVRSSKAVTPVGTERQTPRQMTPQAPPVFSTALGFEVYGDSGVAIVSGRSDEDAKRRVAELQSEIESLKLSMQMAISNQPSDSKILVIKDTQLDPLKPAHKVKSAMPLTEDQARELNRSRQKLTGVPNPVQPSSLMPNTEENRAPSSRERTEDTNGDVQQVPRDEITRQETSPLEELVKKSPTDGSVEWPSQSEQLTLQKDLSRASFDGDPFEASRQLIRSMARYTEQFTSEENELLKQLGANTEAYDAYISAVDTKDEAHYSFLQRLKSNKKDIDDHHASLYQMSLANEKMSRYVNMMSSQFRKAKERIKAMEEKEARDSLEMQQALLSNINTKETDPSVPLTLRQLDTLHQLEASLALVQGLGLVKDETTEGERSELMQKIQELEGILTSQDEPIDEEKLDTLVRNVQDFIGGVKNASPRVDKDEFTGHETIEQLKSDLSRVRKIRDNLARESKYAKAREETFKEQIVQLNNKIATEKEMMENDVRGYKAQIAALRSTFDAISGGDKGSPEEVANKVKRQILNMQALMDASAAERDLFKSKADDAEESLKQAEETISQLSHQVEELMMNAPEEPEKQTTEAEMFRDADIEQLREERAADRIVAEQQRMQLETAAGQNKALNNRCTELEQKVVKMRQEIQQAHNTIDDLRLRSASAAEGKRPPCAHKAVQCGLGPATQVVVKEVVQRNEAVDGSHRVVEQQVEVAVPEVETEEVEEVQQEEEETEEEVTSSVVQTPIRLSQPSSINNSRMSLEGSRNLSSSEMETEPFFFFEDNDNFGELVKKEDKHEFQYNLDDIAQQVHKPLDWAIKKPRVVLPVAERKTSRTTRVPPHHSSYKFTFTGERQDYDLSVNGAPQGKRTLTGTVGPIRPITVMARPRKEDGNHGGSIPIVESTSAMPKVQLDGVQYSPQPMNTATQPHSNYRESQQYLREQQRILREKISLERLRSLNDSQIEPMRITLFVHKEDQKKEKDESPMIITHNETQRPAITPTTGSSMANGVRGMTIRGPEQSPELKEATKIIARLREQLRKSQEQNEKKDMDIIALKQKVSELMLMIHRLKLDNIKHVDDVKRSKIRYDNVKSRLDICFKEIGIRDDEITQLKREIMVLKKLQQPVNSSLARMQNAQRERERLKREEERRKAVAAVAENALKSVASEETKKHLAGLLQHEQISIARLEAQRRMWSEIERKHMMGVLGAMSLLPTSQYKTVREVLPEYSPFTSTKVSALKQLLARSRDYRAYDLNTKKPPGHGSKITYADKIAVLDRVAEPPLTLDEKRMVIKHMEPPEVEDRLIQLIEAERDQGTISKAELETTQIPVRLS